MSQLKILVTGCTGNQGGTLARALLKKGHTVHGLTRNPGSEKARDLAGLGAEIVKGDFDDSASLRKAMSGVDALFAMGTPYEAGTDVETRQGFALVDAAKAAGISHLLYASVSDANRNTGIPHFDSKLKVEKHIQDLDIPYTIVAPVYFFDNMLSPFVLPSLKKGSLAMSLPPDRALQGVAVSDIGSFDVMVLEKREEFLGKRINIASDELTMTEYSEAISEASGREIRYTRLTTEQLNTFGEDWAKMEMWFDRVGYSADIEMLRRNYPEIGWHRFNEWAETRDWSVLR
jgi:uncharacterized protein YbjT (DUF2867 family)